MVQSRPRYIVGCMPRVNGGSPGSPGSVPSGSKIGGSGAPYVVSNFARSGTRLVASAYFVRSHSARSRLFFGIVAMVRGAVEYLVLSRCAEALEPDDDKRGGHRGCDDQRPAGQRPIGARLVLGREQPLGCGGGARAAAGAPAG